MSELRSVLDRLANVDLDSLSAGELGEEIVEAVHGQQVLEVFVARCVKKLADRNEHVDLGYPSPTSFLTHQARMSGGHAKQVVSRAHASERSPHAFAAWSDDRLSTDQARWVFSLSGAVPDKFPAAEAWLVDVVEGLSVKDTRKALEYWRQSVDGPGELDSHTQFARRCLSSSKTTGGMRWVQGWLTPTAGDALDAALASHMSPPADGDTRTIRQRRHDALEDLCRDWLDHGDTPVVGGEKPHIMYLSDLDALQGVAGGLHETLDGEIVSVDALRQIACDCSISRIILGPDSEILDVGRKTRVWTAAQRRAIIARDRHCQAYGCDRDPRWCDIHHEDHWADGGTTSVDKGKLFCRFHHTTEHLKEAARRRRDRAQG